MLSETVAIGEEDCGKCTPRVSRTIRGKHFHATTLHKHTKCLAGIRQVCFYSQAKAERIKPHDLSVRLLPDGEMYPSTTSSLFALIIISFINYSQESPASNISLFLFVFLFIYANEPSLSKSESSDLQHQESQPIRSQHSMHMAKFIAAHHLGHI